MLVAYHYFTKVRELVWHLSESWSLSYHVIIDISIVIFIVLQVGWSLGWHGPVLIDSFLQCNSFVILAVFRITCTTRGERKSNTYDKWSKGKASSSIRSITTTMYKRRPVVPHNNHISYWLVSRVDDVFPPTLEWHWKARNITVRVFVCHPIATVPNCLTTSGL
jgi:hypothetical protein